MTWCHFLDSLTRKLGEMIHCDLHFGHFDGRFADPLGLNT